MHFLFSLLLIVSSATNASENAITIENGSIFTIDNFNTEFKEGVYYFNKNKVIMKDNSTIRISDSFSSQTVRIIIKDFLAQGNTQIIQGFIDPVPFPNSNYFDIYKYDKHPRAAKGKDGPGSSDTFADDKTLRGRSGENGSGGSQGRSTARLFFDIGIRKIDNLKIVVMSESGGHGGNGGHGYKGHNCEDIANADKAENGGSGGNGGKPGLAGSINDVTINWWELTPTPASSDNLPLGLTVLTIPGISGISGFPGLGGVGGDGMDWQLGTDCKRGENGKVGNWYSPFLTNPTNNTPIFVVGKVGKIEASKIPRRK